LPHHTDNAPEIYVLLSTLCNFSCVKRWQKTNQGHVLKHHQWQHFGSSQSYELSYNHYFVAKTLGLFKKPWSTSVLFKLFYFMAH